MTEKIVDASGVRDDPDEPNVPWYYKTLEEEDGPDWNDDYVGTGRPSMKLHAVIIKKPTDLNEAKQIASSIIKNPKKMPPTPIQKGVLPKKKIILATPPWPFWVPWQTMKKLQHDHRSCKRN